MANALKGMLEQIDLVDEIEALNPEPVIKATKAAQPRMMTSSASFAAISAMEHSDRAEQSADRADAALDGCMRTVSYTQTVAKQTALLTPQVQQRIDNNEEIFADHRRKVNDRISLLESALKRTGIIVSLALMVSIPATALVTSAIVTNSINSQPQFQSQN